MSRKQPRYLLPASFAKSNIPKMYSLVQGFTESGLYNAETPAIAKGVRDLLKKVNELPSEGDFRMTFSDCVLLYGIIVKLKLSFHAIQPRLEQDEAEGRLIGDGGFTAKMGADLQIFTDKLMDDMCETFPLLTPEVARFRKDLHEADLAARRMEADNEIIVLHFHMTREIELMFLHLIFQMFDYMIIKSDYDFSEGIREAGFFYLSDYQEVYEKVAKAARGNIMTIDFTLRDIMVVYTVSNITQKLYFTDASNDFMAIFDKVSAYAENSVSGIELRNLYLQLAARITDVIEQQAGDENVFTDFIGLVKDFMI